MTLALVATSLVGCGLTYKIDIKTVIRPDGVIERVATFAEKKDAWSRFSRPSAPYEVSQDTAAAATATATFEPGQHPSGWCPIVAPPGPIEDDKDTGRRFVPGEFRVSVDDVLVGRVFQYDETLPIGVDSEQFRRDLPTWLELGEQLFVDALTRMAPDLDTKPLARVLAEDFRPRLSQRIPRLRDELAAAISLHRLRNDQTRWFDEFRRLFLAFTREFALERHPTEPSPRDRDRLGQFFDEEGWDLATFFDQQIWIHLGVGQERRQDLTQRVGSGEFDSAWMAAVEDRYPTPEARARVEADLFRFLVSGLGFAPVGIFDTYEVGARCELPGRLLLASGDLSDRTGVQWVIPRGWLALASPSFSALSFSRAPWLREETADSLTLAQITEIREFAQQVPAAERDRAKQLLERGCDQPSDWPTLREAARADLSTAALEQTSRIFDLLHPAK